MKKYSGPSPILLWALLVLINILDLNPFWNNEYEYNIVVMFVLIPRSSYADVISLRFRGTKEKRLRNNAIKSKVGLRMFISVSAIVWTSQL